MNTLDSSAVESSRCTSSTALSNSSTVPESPGQATESEEIYNALINSAELLLRCQFEDALSILVPFHDRGNLSAANTVAIARAEARVLMSRGYPRRARNVLFESKEAVHQKLDAASALELSVHLAYVTFVGCGEPLENDSVLKEGQSVLDEYEIDNYNQSRIEMQSQLDKITIVKQTLNRPQHGNCLPRIGRRLDRLMQRSRSLHHYQELWILSVPYFAAKSEKEVISWLEDILSDTQLPRCLYAQFELELAKRRIQDPLNSNFDECLTNADAAFEEVGHAFGKLEVRRLRLQHEVEEKLDPLQALVDILIRYIEADYPIGVLQAAISPLTLAFNRGNYGLYINLQECFHNVCKEAGIKLEGMLLEIQLLAALNAGTGHYATVIRLGEALYKECQNLKYWTMAYLSGRVLSLALNMRRRSQESLAIAQELYDMCQREGLEALSEATYHLAVIRGSSVQHSSRDRVADCHEIAKFLLPILEADIENQEINMACEKLSFVAGLWFEIARISTEKYQISKNEGCAIIERIRALACRLDGNDRVITEGNCDEMICIQLLFEGSKQNDDTMELEGLQICTKLIETYDRQDLKLHSALRYQVRGLFRQQLYKKQGDMTRKKEQLIAAEKDLKHASDSLQDIGSWQQALVASHALARVHVETWDLVKIPFGFVMDSLQQLEAIADRQRRELSLFGGLTALVQKQKYSGTSQLQDLYNWAIGVSVLSTMQHDVLVWSQKRKARSLSEILGLGILVPASVKESLRGDSSTEHVLDELQTLKFAFESASLNEKAYIMQRYEDCEGVARKNPVYSDFIALRDGVVSRISELGVLQAANDTAKEQRALIFADWIVRADSLYLVTADASSPETTCRMHLLPVTLSAVRAWMTRHFQTDNMRKECLQRDGFRDDSRPLRTLDDLISPLRCVSQPGDLLLLSPTAVLSALPLHALRIDAADKMPLIQRNPVVYVPSLPIAKICASRAGQAEKEKSHKSLFFGAFDKAKEAKLIYEQMDSFATATSGQSFCDQAATKQKYVEEVTNARLIHHHMHCVFTADNILKQSIVLTAPDQQPSTRSNDTINDSVTGNGYRDGPASAENLSALKKAKEDMEETLLMSSSTDSSSTTNLTVEEIFNLSLNSPLVVLIACESASQKISEGDEPLGLITGYLCAGAASVIGASWRVPSNAGRQFSKRFYREILNSRSDFINLAVTLQKAVLAVRNEFSTSSTYHWGAFCLSGAWLFQPSWPPRSEA